MNQKITACQILDFSTCEKELGPIFRLNTKYMTTFNELFYRFSIWDKDPKTKINPDGHRQCKLCLEHTDKPLKVHTAIHCTALKPHRRAFCQNIHTALGKIYKKGIWVHQQDYAQTVLQTLHNIATRIHLNKTRNASGKLHAVPTASKLTDVTEQGSQRATCSTQTIPPNEENKDCSGKKLEHGAVNTYMPLNDVGRPRIHGTISKQSGRRGALKNVCDEAPTSTTGDCIGTVSSSRSRSASTYSTLQIRLYSFQLLLPH